MAAAFWGLYKQAMFLAGETNETELDRVSMVAIGGLETKAGAMAAAVDQSNMPCKAEYGKKGL